MNKKSEYQINQDHKLTSLYNNLMVLTRTKRNDILV